jgi:tetratricopeptide (TPR) repeat protein
MQQMLLERSAQLIAHKRYQDAANCLRDALREEPSSAEAMSMLAICLSELNALEEASRLIKQAIGLQPDNDKFLYLYASFLLRNDNVKEASTYILSAILYNPHQADYFGLLASIHLSKKEWKDALENANKGLEVEAENLTCLNIRSTALFKLGQKENSFEAIKEALSFDPESDFTHANLGWGHLERRDHQKALESFRQALKLNPENDLAKAGLVESLKARYLFYRLFLRYAFWVGNLKAKGQWFFLIGMYVGSRILNNIADTNSELAIFLKPLVYAYFAFAISTWLIEPLSNLFLRLNVYGKYALKKEDIAASNFVGIALVLAVLSGTLYLLLHSEVLFIFMLYSFFMMLPLGSMFSPQTESKQRLLVAYTILLALVGLVSVIVPGISILWIVFLAGIFLYQWVVNALLIR